MNEENLVRLQKLIAQAGLASRRHAEKMIQEGRVKLNGKVVKELGVRANPAKDRIAVDDKDLPINRENTQNLTILLHKPRGVICTAHDPEGRQTVFDLLDAPLPRLFNIGRLDFNTEGVLLLTNDGELANRLTHPRHQVSKIYEVRIGGRLSAENITRMQEGFSLDGKRTRPVEIEEISRTENNTWYSLVLQEGRNRQIHRMMEHFGQSISRLRRVQMGPITLDGLRPGAWRHLSEKELKSLQELTATGKEPPPTTNKRRPGKKRPPRSGQRKR